MIILLIILAFFFGFIASLLQAFVAIQLWMWFIVPTFGLPPLGLVTAMGITLLISLLFKSRADTADTGDKDMGEVFEGHGRNLMTSVIISAVTLGVGYIYQLFL
jgi:hypothetical protein